MGSGEATRGAVIAGRESAGESADPTTGAGAPGASVVAAAMRAAALVAPLRRGPHPGLARAQVYDLLRELIVSLQLPPGERVSDAAWAEQLGVSRTPVREALLQLADEGLVYVVPQRGTFVARISVDAVREAQFVREALETAALKEAVAGLRDGDARRLRDNLAQQREAERDGDADRFYALDQEFHRALLDASGHPHVWRVAHRSRAHMDRVRRLSLPEPDVIPNLIDQHERIATFLLSGDGAAAEAALRDHLRLVAINLDAIVAQHPDHFEAQPA
jgi:DNA-binding GntR family transcriptional regulator